jgi:hypothetical protein
MNVERKLALAAQAGRGGKAAAEKNRKLLKVAVHTLRYRLGRAQGVIMGGAKKWGHATPIFVTLTPDKDLPPMAREGYIASVDVEDAMLAEFPELDRFLSFIVRRELVRIRRLHGQPYPWCDDDILNTYRFCNIRREDDTVTTWLREHWRDPHRADPDLWFAMMVARFINQPVTLERLGYPVPFDPDHMLAVLSTPNKGGISIYRAAYMVRSDIDYTGKPKAEYLIEAQFKHAWNNRKRWRPDIDDSLNSYHTKLMGGYGMGSFMAAQLVADLKHVQPLKKASDWNTFAASGPGSRKGLNVVMGREMDKPWSEEDWRFTLGRLIEAGAPKLKEKELTLDAQDWQNCLCEFSKWWKAFTGIGRPKQKFKPPLQA